MQPVTINPKVPVATARSFFAPAVTGIVFLAILFSLCCETFAVRLLGDAGIGWHIRDGEEIVRTHTIPHTDPFSVSMAGHPWYAWEWLYDVLIAAIHGWLGLNGVVLFTALVIAITFAMVLRLAVRRGAGLPVSMLLLMLSIGAASIHFLARPHVLSWLFVVVWFHLVDSDIVDAKIQPTRRIFWCPLIMLLWVNVHGGFLLGFVILILYAGGEAIRFLSGKDRACVSNLKRLGVVLALSLAASFANPYGYKLYAHLYQYLTNRFLMDHIDEFLSPNFHGAAQQCFVVLLLISLIALAVRRQNLHPARLLVIMFAAYSGLYSSRNLPLASILLTLIIAPVLSEAIAAAAESKNVMPSMRRLFVRLNSFSNRMNAMELRSRGHLWAALGFIVALAICIHGGRIGSSQWMNAHFDPQRFPVKATDVIAERGIHDPIFCPDNWGGYLIYRLYPQSKVFIDDRHDLYGEEFLKRYLQVVHVGPEWGKLLDQLDVNWVLTPTNSSLRNVMKESPQWGTVYVDTTAVLFERKKK